MNAYSLPLTSDPWQVFTTDVNIDGVDFHAQIGIRYLPAPDQWVISIWDHSTGELLVNMIPLICSCGEMNDLLEPFRHLREGKGAGCLLCLRGTEEPSTGDPAGGNLTEFRLLFLDERPEER